MMKILQIVLITFLFTGCIDISSSGNSVASSSCDYIDFTVNPLSSDANIKVEKSSDSECTLVTLTQGSAEIILDTASIRMVLNQTYSVESDLNN